MSRNFELLNQMGQADVTMQPQIEPARAENNPAEFAFTPTQSLEIDGIAREELTKLVHRLFHAQPEAAQHFGGLG